MYKFCVFAGTTEGRRMAEFLSEQKVSATVCVATDYGESLIRGSDNLKISSQRLSLDEMSEMLSREKFDLVIDATHPYALEATKNISDACRRTNTEYLRVTREKSGSSDGCIFVPDTESAVRWLQKTTGHILLTTGSKEIMQFASMENFSERVFARVLPMAESLSECEKAGLLPKNIIAMQGPFSKDMNVALIRQTQAKYLVTKDGGNAGGFCRKAAAAEECGINLLVIGRPKEECGLSFSEAIELLCRDYGLIRRPVVDIVGIGPGGAGGMTAEVRNAIDNADCLIGAGRMLESVSLPEQPTYNAILPADIADFIKSHREYEKYAVVMSGDTGFFSGTKKLLPLLDDCRVNVLPGLSSLSCLCARLKTSYEDVSCVSVHGREHDIVCDVLRKRRVFTLVGGENGMSELCKRLTSCGLGDVRVSVGERLGYPDERITCGSAEELSGMHFETLSAALIENDRHYILPVGIRDEEFTRGVSSDGAIVPMTKSEVRAVCISKLQLTRDSVCWDVGAGTGSVSVEMALISENGHVYAIERKKDAVSLMEKNRERFFAENLSVIEGRAPEALSDLPAPTHVFIGGTGGSMREIISTAVKKNPDVRIVATAIALESVSELTAVMSEFNHSESVCLNVARGRKVGSYSLMTGQNPIYIFTFQN